MAANKPTAVHFSLIFFVMATIVAGVLAYMFNDQRREAVAKLAAAEKERDAQKSAALKANTQVNALKTKIGHNHPEIGEADPNIPNTVLNAMTEDIKSFSLTNPADYRTALSELKTALEAEKAKLAQEMQTNAQNTATIAALRTDYDKKVQDYDTERKAAVDAQQKAEEEHKVALQTERDNFQKVSGELNKAKVQMQEDNLAHEQAIAEKDTRITNLTKANDMLRDKFDKATQVSFEQPDGLIQWVDNTSKLVWINLGSADNLPVRTNFSVYHKGHRGVGRDSESTLKGPEDLKGAIEVTRILGPHMAEARILEESYFEPIAIDDPIYTPVWGPNQSESFAFVGLIDIDHDGRSDRDYLHDVLSSVGAKVQTEVDDDGNRTGVPINERTKFLVVGAIPALEDQSDKEVKDAINRMHEHLDDLKKEAREQGVRVVTLNDFLAFMGIKPRQRVFRPGDNRPFTLKAGSQSTSTTQSIGSNRVSAGQTSGVYSKSRRIPQPTSSGQTSGAYGGNR